MFPCGRPGPSLKFGEISAPASNIHRKYMGEKAENFEHADQINVKKKLSKLYGGQLKISEETKRLYFNSLSV